MEDIVLQEVNIILDSMVNSKAKLKQTISWKKDLKILVGVILLLAFIKGYGFDLVAVTVILIMMKLFLGSNVPEYYYIMHHVKNDTKVFSIITALQEEAINRDIHIMSIDIVEHKSHTYLQIRY